MSIFQIGAIAVLATAATLAGAANTQPAFGAEGSIPFAVHNIFTWQADGDKGMWVQSNGRTWYYGAFSYPCLGLQFHNGVGFKFGPQGELDKWAEVRVRRNSVPCLFKTFLVSPGPPSTHAPPPTTAPVAATAAPAA